MHRIKEEEEYDDDDFKDISVMDDTKVELLISAVQTRPPIWQNDHPGHHNAHILSPLWKEIESPLKEEKDDCRKKWKSLVTRMKKELRLIPKARSGDAASTYKSKWKWFEVMRFIEKYAREKESKGNLDEAIAAYDAAVYEQEGKKDHEVKNHQVKKYVRLQKASRAQISSQDLNKNLAVSDDETYFKTIVRYVAKLSPEQNLKFREKVSQLVRKYAFPNLHPEEKSRKRNNDGDRILDWCKHSEQDRMYVGREPFYAQPHMEAGTYDRGLQPLQSQGYGYLDFVRYSTQSPALMEPDLVHPHAERAVLAHAELHSHRVNMEEDN